MNEIINDMYGVGVNQINFRFHIFCIFLSSFLFLISCTDRSPSYPPLESVPSISQTSEAALIFSGLPASAIAGMGLSPNLSIILGGTNSGDLSVKNGDATAGTVGIALYSNSLCTAPVSLAPDGSPALIGYTPLPMANGRVQLPNLAITRAQSLYIRASYQGRLSDCTPISILSGQFSENYGKLTFSSNNANAGQSVDVTYTAYDAYGNRSPSGISASNLSFSIISGGGTFTPTATSGNGVFTSVFLATSAGGILATATNSNAPAVSSPAAVDVVPGVAASLVIATPSLIPSGGTVSAVVTAYDAYGNIATADVSSITLTSNDNAAVITPSPGTLSAGVTTFSATLNTPTVGKTALLTAASGGLSATSAGIAVGFIANIIYDTSTVADYSYSSSFIDFTAAHAELTDLTPASGTLTDNSNAVAGFGGATLSGTVWDSSYIALNYAPLPNLISFGGATAYQGTVTSRIYPWSPSASISFGGVSLAWTSNLPYGKALPATSESSAVYSSQVSNMMANVVGIFHMDETAGPTLNDASGNSMSLTTAVVGGGSISYGQQGLLNSAVSFNKGYAYSSDCSALCMASPAITIAAWVNIPNLPTTDMSIVSIDSSPFEGNGQESIEIYYSHGSQALGCNFNTENNGEMALNVPYVSGWMHIACTFTVANDGTLYVNGARITDTDTVYGGGEGPLNMEIAGDPVSIYIGKEDLPYTGLLDEVAVWSGALSAGEIADICSRGGSQIWFQVRGCADASCSANPPFIGPDGTSTSYYSEVENTSPQSYPTGALATVLTTAPDLLFHNFATTPIGVYVQYQATLLSLQNGRTPELNSVTLMGGGYEQGSVSTMVGAVTLSSSVGGLTSFSDVENCTAGGVVYNLSTDAATWYYWNGSGWAQNLSGTLIYANTASVVNAQIASFMTSGTLYVKAFLQSDGQTPCTLSSVQVKGYQ